MQYNDELIDLEGDRLTVARTVSRLTPAPLINLYVGIIIALTSPIGLGPILGYVEVILICIMFMVILPVVPIILAAWKGSVDLDVSERANRPKFFLNAILWYMLAYIIYGLLQCDVMRVLSAAYITVTTGVLIANQVSKVSVHGAGVGGPGTALIFIYGILALPVVLLWIGVVWSRTYLKQHTLIQSIMGVTMGVLITIATYTILYVPIVYL
ncbi:MAG: conserved membrane protein of unknown function [Candidatus Thorarchaeota archaeon]|nr:MAG: conserved membrane protein of unknown function [Candidatus Thorarchaeota archaeon]